MGAEGQPVDQCRNQVLFSNSSVHGERQIGGDDGAGPFAAVRDDLEEQLRFVFVETHVAELVQNQQIRLIQQTFNATQLVCVTGFRQFCGKASGVLEQNPISLQAGFQSNGNGNVSLAPSGIANHDDVLGVHQ